MTRPRGAPPSAFDAVVFDLDGLLIDTETIWPRAEIEVFAGLGVELSFADCRQTMGMRLDEVVAYWRERRPWTGPTDESVAAAVVDRVVDMIADGAHPMPGAVETVEWMAGAGVTLAVASSSWEEVIDAALEVLGIRDLFAAVHSAEHDPFGKPHPAVYLRTCAAVGAEPRRAMALEDSVAGAKAARAAGMTCVVVPYDRPPAVEFDAVADAVLDSLYEVDGELLDRLAEGTVSREWRP